MKLPLTARILVGMALGIGAGIACRAILPDAGAATQISGYFSLIADLFLRLIKMIIAPLVFCTLVVGITRIGDVQTVGRIGIRTLGWFLVASFVSLVLGALIANWLHPGSSLDLPLPAANVSTGLNAGALSLREFFVHLVPSSIVEAMANNEILQIVVFAAFFGVGLTTLGEKAALVVSLLEQVSYAMLKVTGYVMSLAPFAVFGAIASVVTTRGISVLVVYGRFMGEFYGSLVVLWLLLTSAGAALFGGRVFDLVRLMRIPMLIGFSTASSEAVYPKTLEQLERFGVPRRIASFVLPIGYSFNLDGTMMYCTFATLFIAQAYGIHLSLVQQVSMLAILMLTSKGMAAVPRASLVVIAATLSQFNIPGAGLLLIMGVDHFLDMGRTATNVLGNAVASAAVAKWEGVLAPSLSQPHSVGGMDDSGHDADLPDVESEQLGTAAMAGLSSTASGPIRSGTKTGQI
ncbi:dicarboxylate/amino acid:cation symporter [Burkholderia multivorans]|uniref:dicarboxylate/amino acid:cation symporter n=1 Tax=Burkholderia multivorans TaxID=87883 RepID=UPI0020A0CCE5|nr:dicarboxylate/amino acid:cation symporter [Burkholderia multivorans]MCO8611180.1 dicarboxylate/amino acid:cation symporter [Burkholderia multivorans]MCO8638031.1 dicarboxylate/amino acid:cation symporter [Burkholderia multivorans]MCO8646183.1 dicarboxylate/amino acid:cation symporter [Burkholderia multivorans]